MYEEDFLQTDPDDFFIKSGQDPDDEAEAMLSGPGSIKGKTEGFLNQADYNLDSPLLIEGAQALEAYVHRRRYLQIHYRPHFEELDKWYRADSNVNNLTCSGVHQWFASLLLKRTLDCSLAIDFMNGVDADAELTAPFLTAFLKGWTGENITKPPLAWTAEMKVYLQIHMDCHALVLLSNARIKDEHLSLSKTFKTRIRYGKKKEVIGHYVNTSSFGDVLVSYEFVHIIKDRKILGHDFLLSMKDICIGRFQTLLAMMNRVDDKFTMNDVNKMIRLYRAGDRLVETKGFPALKVIKVLEPSVTEALAKKAQENRPLIPELPSFRLHIEQSHRALTEEFGALASDFLNILKEDNSVDLMLTMFGSFRQWGHPFIDLPTGLQELFERVTQKLDVDPAFANKMASSFAYKVLHTKFLKDQKWYVDLDKMPPEHVLRVNVEKNTWPSPEKVKEMGDNWHELPIIAMFDIPDMMPLGDLLGDKSHSMQKSEVLHHVSHHPHKKIPTRKVLQTFLTQPDLSAREFCQEMNDKGLDDEDLIIGLKPKEKELKTSGRYFSLMSYRMRLYFVITEHLIAEHILPMFNDITMTFDWSKFVMKTSNVTEGQGNPDYEHITIANHLDYTKWNNLQRIESNGPLFRVMGKCFGMSELFYRTHQFFKQSLIYYPDRPDLMVVNGNTLENKDDNFRVCWQGQDGGLEGLRQKGWSILSLLILYWAASSRNTKIKNLTQGDNQILFMIYLIRAGLSLQDLIKCLEAMIENNEAIMANVYIGVEKLGMQINKDETLQSSDYMVYGKNHYFRGNLMGLETKKVARITGSTNDQIPSLANILSTAVSSSLSVAHQSTSPVNAMMHYNLMGNFIRHLGCLHDPLLKKPPREVFQDPGALESLDFKISYLYLPPSLGGVTGVSFATYLLRQFPDSVTESLITLKTVIENSDGEIKQIALKMANPEVLSFKPEHLEKLIEDPSGLNIRKGASALTIVKNLVRKGLYEKRNTIASEMLRVSLEQSVNERQHLVDALLTSNPFFPRLLSELLNCTFSGLCDQVVKKFENSATIRLVFAQSAKGIVSKMVRAEVSSLGALIRVKSRAPAEEWECCSSKADQMRNDSWGREVIGATIPHPMEMMKDVTFVSGSCEFCSDEDYSPHFVSVILPKGLTQYNTQRGPFRSYLGSKTKESTGVVQPYEKVPEIPLLKKAADARRFINWCIEPDSKLANFIFNNINSMYPMDWQKCLDDVKRTGSAIHRLQCSRQSAGGYTASSPSKSMYMIASTDGLSALREVNYDFMYQSLLLYCQITSGELHDMVHTVGTYHFHLSCKNCLREIVEPVVDIEFEPHFTDVSHLVKRMIPEGVKPIKDEELIALETGHFEKLNREEQSYHVGRAQGLIFADKIGSLAEDMDFSSLFTITVATRVSPDDYWEGLWDGLMRGACLTAVTKEAIYDHNDTSRVLCSCISYLIDSIKSNPHFLKTTTDATLLRPLRTRRHKMPSSFPSNDRDKSNIIESFLRFKLMSLRSNYRYKTDYPFMWVFADFYDSHFTGLMIVTDSLVKLLIQKSLSSGDKIKVKSWSDTIPKIRARIDIPLTISRHGKRIRLTISEIRFACKEMTKAAKPLNFPIKKTIAGGVTQIKLEFCSELTSLEPISKQLINPTISGLRPVQWATGAHYKIACLLYVLKLLAARGFAALGDGSGGIAACLARKFPHKKFIFNSLPDYENVSFNGTEPTQPSAIKSLPDYLRENCVNGHKYWMGNNDLSTRECWADLVDLKIENNMTIDIVVMDMETRSEKMSAEIEERVRENICDILSERGCLIYKTYLTVIEKNPEDNALTRIGSMFRSVSLCQTEFSSTGTSEVYMVCKGLHRKYHEQKYPEYEKLIPEFRKLYINSSLTSEFKRAIKVSRMDLMKGFPQMYIPDPQLELCSILNSCGVDPGTALETVYMLPRMKGTVGASVLLILLNHFFYNTTSFHKEAPAPCSDEKCLKVLGVMNGLYLWIALSTRSESLFSRAHNMCNSNITVGFGGSKFKCKKGVFYRGSWSFIDKKRVRKTFSLRSVMALSGSIIRYLHILYGPTKESIDWITVHGVAKRISNKISCDSLYGRTGIYEIYSQEIVSNDSVNFSDFETSRVDRDTYFD